jgi:hypothetical protein
MIDLQPVHVSGFFAIVASVFRLILQGSSSAFLKRDYNSNKQWLIDSYTINVVYHLNTLYNLELYLKMIMGNEFVLI